MQYFLLSEYALKEDGASHILFKWNLKCFTAGGIEDSDLLSKSPLSVKGMQSLITVQRKAEEEKIV